MNRLFAWSDRSCDVGRPAVRPFAIGLGLGLAAMAALTVSSALAETRAPDLDGFWTVRFERPDPTIDLIAELPEGAVMIDDAGGGELATGDFAGLRLSERAREELRQWDPADELLRENTCVSPSVVYNMQAPFPIEIHQGRDIIVIRMEYFDQVRVLFLDDRPRPDANAPHTRSGFSLGRWEGDTLVVETTHIAPGTLMNNGFNHSENLRMTERFRLSPDGRTLRLTQLYEDPDTFEGLAARYMAWTRVPGEHIYPYDCDPSYGI
jgi:hypothetical protein